MGICFSKDDEGGAVATGGTGGTGGEAPASTNLRRFVEPSVVVARKIGAKAKELKTGGTAKAHHVRNIFATPFEMLDLATFRPPEFEHTEAETQLIEAALKRNFVFEHMSAKESVPLVKAFEKTSVEPNAIIITQGDEGNYFYIIQSGTCAFEVDGNEVGRAKAGDSFGELALLYNCPRAATVRAIDAASLFRVDQKTFRYILQAQTKEGTKEKVDLLRGVDFLKDLGDADVNKLVDVMTPKRFVKGDYLMHKGAEADNFYLIQEGTVNIHNITAGNVKYEDLELGPGGYAGERAIITGEKRAADAIALTDGLAFVIDKATFAAVFGDLQDLISHSLDKQRLTAIKLFVDSEMDEKSYAAIAALIEDQSFSSGSTITKAGKQTEAALYIIREGKVEAKKADGTTKVLEAGGYTGVESLTADVKSGKNGRGNPTTVVAEETLTVLEDCVCGVLTLCSLRTVINTVYLGTGNKDMIASASECSLKLEDLKRLTLLGAGTFGQVWLVSAADSKGEKQVYALKIQSKYELIQDGQAKAVAYEKAIMAKMNHPFIIKLENAYQDEKFVYMLMQLIQGGELYSVIHSNRRHGVPEQQARFYAAGIADGLAYMHRRSYVYRDLKPENVMIDSDGYPVIIDFGFAKYVKDKTFTLCGTPLYLAPEVILNRGHNWGADHWSLGILIYELITGETPFYEDGMEQMDLMRAIVKCNYKMPRKIPPEARSIVDGLVKKDPAQRLGNLKGGEDDILNHPWFWSYKGKWDEFRNKEMKAPMVPTIKNPLDTSNFDDWSHLDDKTKQKYPKLKPDEQKIFEGF